MLNSKLPFRAIRRLFCTIRRDALSKIFQKLKKKNKSKVTFILNEKERIMLFFFYPALSL